MIFRNLVVFDCKLIFLIKDFMYFPRIIFVFWFEDNINGMILVMRHMDYGLFHLHRCEENLDEREPLSLVNVGQNCNSFFDSGQDCKFDPAEETVTDTNFKVV